MNLFQLGDFTLSSGARSGFKIECDALDMADVETLAKMISQMVGPFNGVEGVPTGGMVLAAVLRKYCSLIGPYLIVDDVLTTGGSMDRLRDERAAEAKSHGQHIVGAVVFARGQCPHWVSAVFQLPECFWVKPRMRGA